MLVRSLVIIMSFMNLVSAWAQPNCVTEEQCRSQLLRVEVSNSILRNSPEGLLPILQDFAKSPTLPSLIEKDYTLQPGAFPHNMEKCLREKKLNPDFASI